MLILSRKVGEGIVVVEPRMRIVVCEIKAGRVRIGIEADEEVRIVREELVQQ
jgi:carbon storage regulator CsrA